MCRATSFTDNSTALAETAFGRAEVRWSQRERSVDENVSKFSLPPQLRSGFVIKRVEFLQLNKGKPWIKHKAELMIACQEIALKNSVLRRAYLIITLVCMQHAWTYILFKFWLFLYLTRCKIFDLNPSANEPLFYCMLLTQDCMLLTQDLQIGIFYCVSF